MRGGGRIGGGGGGSRLPGTRGRFGAAGATTSAAPGSARRNVRLPPPRSLPRSGEYAVLGLTPLASRSDVKHAYKRLALKYHPDVIRGESAQEREDTFREIKSAYESLMVKFEEERTPTTTECHNGDEWEEWEEWMGFEGGIPIVYNPS